MPGRVMRAVLSGSFHKDQKGLRSAYDELVTCGFQVLSPHRLDFDDTKVLFVRDHAERNTSEEVLEKHHLLSIAQADLLWVHTFEGSVGVSTAFEIGYALAHDIPIFCRHGINEPNLQAFVQIVPSVYQALVDVTMKA